MTRILINGAFGKMGTATRATIEEHPDFTLAASLGRQDDLAQAIDQTQPKIVIDFTNADVVFQNTQIIIDKNCHPVIGSSGLSQAQIDHLQRLSREKKLGGIIAPNFSIGAILMMRYAADAARYLKTAEIIETHHQYKLDSPSGTALKTAEMMAKHRETANDVLLPEMKETIPGARGALHHEIPIHSIRIPGTVARQEVLFGGPGETLSILHNSIDRECFMPGVILACKKVSQLNELLYGLDTLID